jgi:hypothetical protein
MHVFDISYILYIYIIYTYILVANMTMNYSGRIDTVRKYIIENRDTVHS